MERGGARVAAFSAVLGVGAHVHAKRAALREAGLAFHGARSVRAHLTLLAGQAALPAVENVGHEIRAELTAERLAVVADRLAVLGRRLVRIHITLPHLDPVRELEIG